MIRHEANLSSVGEPFPWRSFLGIVLAFLLFVCILWIAYVPNRPGYVDEVRIQERLDILKETQAKARKELNHYEWVDPKTQAVRLPINKAMDLIVREYNNPT